MFRGADGGEIPLPQLEVSNFNFANMKRILKIFSLVGSSLFTVSCNNSDLSESERVIVIQPLGEFKSSHSKDLLTGLKVFKNQVYIKQSIEIPKSFYVHHRKRYRADSIIKFLRQLHGKDTLTVGITDYDISTTKNGIQDWGVMGLGYRPGKSCVVSTFRLHKRNMKEQFCKVVLHEIGHTFGLPHCEDKTCLMRDAEGGNPLNEEKDFCKQCKERLKLD
jgi:archaemetzincin